MDSIISPESLTEEDLAWSRALGSGMITSALAMAQDTGESSKPLYASMRAAALDVRTDDLLGAERWFFTMYSIAARTAGLLIRLAAVEGVPPELMWQSILTGPGGQPDDGEQRLAS